MEAPTGAGAWGLGVQVRIRANLGTHAEVRAFTEQSLKALKATLRTTSRGFTAATSPLPGGLLDALPPGRENQLAFVSDFPVAKGENVLAHEASTGRGALLSLDPPTL